MAGINLKKIRYIFILFQVTVVICSHHDAVYESVELYEYSDFSSTWPFTFNVPEETSLATWYFQATSSHPDSCKNRNVTIYLQHGSLPVINPLGERFPSSFYISQSQLKSLHTISDNHTLSSSLRNPRSGHWFGVASLLKTETKLRPADLFVECKYKFRAWFEMEKSTKVVVLSPEEKTDVALAAEGTRLFKFFIPLNAVNHTVTISNCVVTKDNNSTSCPIILLGKGQGIPGSKTASVFVNCSVSAVEDVCELADIDPVLNDWSYLVLKSEAKEDLTLKLEAKVTETPVLPKPVGKKEIQSQPNYQLLPMLDRFSYNAMYKNRFAYIVGGTVQDVTATITEEQTVVVPFKLEQDSDTGGSLAVEVKISDIVSPEANNQQVAVDMCLQKNKMPFMNSKECSAGFHGNSSSQGQGSTKVILPYPSPETYFVGARLLCFKSVTIANKSSTKETPCGKASAQVSVNVTTDACVGGNCNVQGKCHNYLNGHVLFSTCKCYSGWRGFDCSDGKESRETSQQLLELLLLTLSNALFIPGIILAMYRRHFVEALVYAYTMTFSGLYHACDGDRTDEFKYCALRLSILSFADFLGSALSIWITLVAMARPPKKLKAVLQIAGPLGLLFGVLYKKTSAFLFIAPAGLGLLMIFISWVCRCCYRHKCYPTMRKYLLCLLPGVLLAVGGICIFTFLENEENYLYVHSGWHACMALCIIFLLPPRERKGDYKVRQTNSINLGSTYQPIRPADENYVI